MNSESLKVGSDVKKIIMFSKIVQDYGNGSADICLVKPAVVQAGHSLSMGIQRSL